MSFVRRAAARGAAVRVLVQVAVCCGYATFVSAAETGQKADSERANDRFYAGAGVASLSFDDGYGGIAFSDTSAAIALFGGFTLNDRLSLELSFDSFDAIDLHDLAGSGIVRFDVKTRRRTAAFSVLREVSLKDVFDWKRDWRVFGMAGAYRSNLSRSVLIRNTGVSSSSDDDFAGLVLGAGVLYRVGGVDVRGYVRQFGVSDHNEAREVGIAVQRRF
jgi:hypothetical protein